MIFLTDFDCFVLLIKIILSNYIHLHNYSCVSINSILLIDTHIDSKNGISTITSVNITKNKNNVK